MKGIVFAIIASVFILVNAEEYNDRNDNFTSEVVKNHWQLKNFANENEVLCISMKKYDNSVTKYFYKVLFQSNSQYKMIAPWGETIVNSREIIEIEITKIPIKDMSK